MTRGTPDQRVRRKARRWANKRVRVASELALQFIETVYYPQGWEYPGDGPNANECNRFNRLAVKERRAATKALEEVFLRAYETADEWGRGGED